MSTKPTLIIATRNDGKFREIKAALSDLPFTIKSLRDFPKIGPIKESGTTFKDNALKKAWTVHKVVGGYVLADDSGLVCDDLRGEPGVNSAYFAGPKATDEENNAKLVSEMSQADDPSRSARYVCVMALIDPDKKETIVEETCEGMIVLTPKGKGGFGYDPYFLLPDKNKTMAEISIEEKNRISHRGKALQAIHKILNLSFPR
ncbi:MAG: XTP/dITP diphosphatase [Deltaproteobacteria bacterium]|nr:XTP/dITP diphosphatase [Deltaproteobacteria bacterium]